jgi:hypothetical protein
MIRDFGFGTSNTDAPCTLPHITCNLIGMSEQITAVDTPEGHQDFIQSRWRQFAAFAWSRYLREGRGAVVIDLRRHQMTDSGLQVPAYYVADNGPQLERRGGWPDDEVAGVVRDYDPSQDVVFIVLRLDGDLLYYCVSDELTPPEAFSSLSTAST